MVENPTRSEFRSRPSAVGGQGARRGGVLPELTPSSRVQGRAGPPASTARTTSGSRAACAPATCAGASRTPTSSCCATSATWPSTRTACARRSAASPPRRSGECPEAAGDPAMTVGGGCEAWALAPCREEARRAGMQRVSPALEGTVVTLGCGLRTPTC